MDQTLVTSGFDIELLIGARYIEYILLSLTETGSFSLKATVGSADVDIFQPSDVDRLYEPHANAVPLTASPDSFNTEIIWGHPLGANVRTDIELLVANQFLSAYVRFGLVNSFDPQGRPWNYRIRIEVVALDKTAGLAAALAAADVTDQELLAAVKEAADRDVPLPFAGAGDDIEKIEMIQLPSMDGGPVAMAFCMNLRLRNGPEKSNFLPDRGDVLATMNFLEGGRDIAFAVREGFLTDLSAHQKFLFAEPTNDGSGEFHYPMRRDMFDPASEEIGQLYAVTIGPGIDATNGQFTGEISVKIRGEYFIDNFFDPDFTFTLTLVPSFDNGVITWSHRTDLDATAIGILSFVVFSFAGLIGYAIGTRVTADDVLDDERREQMSGFLESLPVRVPVEMLRWDPFYLTKHQIVTRVDEWLINDKGIAFTGRGCLGMETEPVDHVVMRTEVRDEHFDIVRYDYRVQDHQRHTITLDNTKMFSATDRLTWIQNPSERELFGLTEPEIVARLTAKKIKTQDLLPKKVHLDDHKIFRMQCITSREVKEQIVVVEDAFRRATRLQIVVDQGVALREEARAELEIELGMPPTPQQIDERYGQKLDALVEIEFTPYRASASFESDLERAVDGVLRLDMAPNEYGILQRRNILRVVGYDLIERHNRKHRPGTVTLYYRDRADFNARDNLLSMLKYAIDHHQPN